MATRMGQLFSSKKRHKKMAAEAAERISKQSQFALGLKKPEWHGVAVKNIHLASFATWEISVKKIHPSHFWLLAQGSRNKIRET